MDEAFIHVRNDIRYHMNTLKHTHAVIKRDGYGLNNKAHAMWKAVATVGPRLSEPPGTWMWS